jgi:hypothetical protein
LSKSFQGNGAFEGNLEIEVDGSELTLSGQRILKVDHVLGHFENNNLR